MDKIRTICEHSIFSLLFFFLGEQNRIPQPLYFSPVSHTVEDIVLPESDLESPTLSSPVIDVQALDQAVASGLLFVSFLILLSLSFALSCLFISLFLQSFSSRSMSFFFLFSFDYYSSGSVNAHLQSRNNSSLKANHHTSPIISTQISVAAADARIVDVYRRVNAVVFMLDITRKWTLSFVREHAPAVPCTVPILIVVCLFSFNVRYIIPILRFSHR